MLQVQDVQMDYLRYPQLESRLLHLPQIIRALQTDGRFLALNVDLRCKGQGYSFARWLNRRQLESLLLAVLNQRNIPTYAYKKTNQLLEKHKGLSATHIIEENKFSLLKDKIEVFYPGGGHTADNVVVWLEKPQMLFAGCFVKGLNSKNLGNLEDAVVSKWPASIENTLSAYPHIKHVFPGHGRAGDQSLLLHTAKLAKNYLAEQSK